MNSRSSGTKRRMGKIDNEKLPALDQPKTPKRQKQSKERRVIQKDTDDSKSDDTENAAAESVGAVQDDPAHYGSGSEPSQIKIRKRKVHVNQTLTDDHHGAASWFENAKATDADNDAEGEYAFVFYTCSLA
jgi:hypothetical protein